MAQLFIGVAILLVWYILSKDRGEKEPTSALWAAVGFGLLGLVVAGIIEAVLLPVSLVTVKNLSGNELVTVSLAIGAIEEVCKFLPLALYIYKKTYFNEYNDGVLYFAIAGLGFGVPENILYTLDGGVGTGVLRLIMTPFFHAATTAFVGYFLIRMKLRRGSVTSVLGALAAMITVHAAYDYGLLSGKLRLIGMAFGLTLGLNLLLVLLVSRARSNDERLALQRPQPAPATYNTQLQSGPYSQLPPGAVPAPPPMVPQPGLGKATAALVFGIMAIMFGIIPFIGLLFGVPAVVLGTLVYRQQHGMALAAIITGTLGVLSGLAWVLFVWIFATS